MLGTANQQATDVKPITDKTVVLKLPNGHEYAIMGSLHDRSILGHIEYGGGFYEPHVMNVISQVVKPDFVCMDIGANIGVLTLAISKTAFQGKVFSIECSTKNYAYLMQNIDGNGLVNCIPIHCGVSDKRQRVKFNYVEDAAGCSFISPLGLEIGVSEDVELKTIDEILSEQKRSIFQFLAKLLLAKDIDHVDFIKLDVEGGERLALLGAKNLFAKSQPILLIEFNPNPIQRFYGEDPEDLFKLLTELYPYIYLISDPVGDLKLIKSYDELMGMLTDGKGWEDLLCTFRPVGLHVDLRYDFSQKILGLVSVSGLSDMELWGRWSDATSAELRFVMDNKDLSKNKRGFINFEVQPFLLNDVKAQDISISWGHGRHASTSICKTGWISLPYRKAEWEGCEAPEMTVKFNFHNAISPHDLDPKSDDTRKLAIGFKSISVTKKPLGKRL